jgi:hypothetical protein
MRRLMDRGVRGLRICLLGVATMGTRGLADENPVLPAGGAFGLRVVSDSVPDWSSRENFVRSALSGWTTDHEKATAQFRWSYRGRRVGPDVHENGRSIHDPILFFNSYGVTFCGQISAMNVALWEAAGFPGRMVDVDVHVVAEVFYGGRWRMFDNDFCNYFLDEKGEVVGGRELQAGRQKKDGERWLFDGNPYASGPGGRIFMGPSSWTLSGVADWWKVYEPRPASSCAHAGHRVIMGIRPDERYTRFWQPLGYGEAYARLLGNGRDPVQDNPRGTVLRNSRANGLWVWQPNLADTNVWHAADNVVAGPQGLCARDGQKKAEVVFSVTAAHVVTSLRLMADADPGVVFSVSGDGGSTWSTLEAAEKSGAAREFARAGDPVAGRLGYWLKAQWEGAAALRALELRTVTQVNPRVLPALRLGSNEVAVVRDEPLEYMVFQPRLTRYALEREFHKASGWQSVSVPHDQEPTIRSVGKADLVLRCPVPRDIRHIRMAGTGLFYEPSPGANLDMEASYDLGASWKRIGRSRWNGAPYDERFSFETREIPSGTREVWLRYRATSRGVGIINLVAEVGYEPVAGSGELDIVYAWEEYRDGQWVARTHTERVGGERHRYSIAVGGSRPPRMRSIEMRPADRRAATGYGDRLESVATRRPADYRWRTGERVAVGRPYTVSRPPSAAFPDKADAVLTDGYIGLASYWGLENIALEGKKNEQRVGELVVWPAGEEVTVTVDLGRRQRVGGAVVYAVQPNADVLYPETMVVEVSANGKNYVEAGRAHWEDCFFPAANELQWEGADSPLYESLPAGGITDFKFHIPFEKTQRARYVRFRLKPSVGGRAGVGLWELDVFDRMEKEPWQERLVLP